MFVTFSEKNWCKFDESEVTESSIYSICVFSFLSVERPQDLVSKQWKAEHLKEISTKKEQNATKEKTDNESSQRDIASKENCPLGVYPFGQYHSTFKFL